MTRHKFGGFLAVLVALFLLVPTARPQNQSNQAILLTIFLRHDQSKTLDEINQHAEKTGFRKNFPPAGVDVVSWYVMMGIGQVVNVACAPRQATRGQRCSRARRLGRLPDRVLRDL